jgi:plasmid maintenance system antidote protein VapI
MNIFLEAKEKQNGLTYRKMQENIGIDSGVINNLLHEKRKCSLRVIMKIADYLGIDELDALDAWKDMIYRYYLNYEKDRPEKRRRMNKAKK